MKRHPAASSLCILLLGLAGNSALAAPQGSLVYKGKPIAVEQTRWQVAIHLANLPPVKGLQCGGTVIAPHWILTAAHCFWDRDTGKRVPDYTLALSTGSATLSGGRSHIDVQRIIPHPQYQFGSWDNDIALVHTRTTLSAPFMALAAAEESDRSELLVVGWGNTETALVSDRLLMAAVPQTPLNCAGVDAYDGRLTIRTVCAGTGGADTCQGDSGGPLYRPLAGGRGIQFGVTVGGLGCGKLPGVYAKVIAHRPWIAQQLASTNEVLLDPDRERREAAACTAERTRAGIC